MSNLVDRFRAQAKNGSPFLAIDFGEVNVLADEIRGFSCLEQSREEFCQSVVKGSATLFGLQVRIVRKDVER